MCFLPLGAYVSTLKPGLAVCSIIHWVVRFSHFPCSTPESVPGLGVTHGSAAGRCPLAEPPPPRATSRSARAPRGVSGARVLTAGCVSPRFLPSPPDAQRFFLLLRWRLPGSLCPSPGRGRPSPHSPLPRRSLPCPPASLRGRGFCAAGARDPQLGRTAKPDAPFPNRRSVSARRPPRACWTPASPSAQSPPGSLPAAGRPSVRPSVRPSPLPPPHHPNPAFNVDGARDGAGASRSLIFSEDAGVVCPRRGDPGARAQLWYVSAPPRRNESEGPRAPAEDVALVPASTSPRKAELCAPESHAGGCPEQGSREAASVRSPRSPGARGGSCGLEKLTRPQMADARPCAPQSHLPGPQDSRRAVRSVSPADLGPPGAWGQQGRAKASSRR